MDNTHEVDRLNAWLRIAIRQAELTYRDGRREDDANTPPGHKKGGWPMKAATRRMERTAVRLLNALAAKSKEYQPTRPQAEQASQMIQAFLEKMAKDVQFVVQRTARDSPAAQRRIDDMVEALVADANDSLVVLVADARPLLVGTGRAKARPGPDVDIEWKQKVWTYCDKFGSEKVSNPDWSSRMFLLDVKRFYGLRLEDKPRDARRTNAFRQQWLDAKAGLDR